MNKVGNVKCYPLEKYICFTNFLSSVGVTGLFMASTMIAYHTKIKYMNTAVVSNGNLNFLI